VTTAAGKSHSGREAAAGRLVERLLLRAELNNGVGILQVWNVCGQQQARTDLVADHGQTGQDGEARRMIAVVNAAADGRADPDARWD
jgi:hypothetical protein